MFVFQNSGGVGDRLKSDEVKPKIIAITFNPNSLTLQDGKEKNEFYLISSKKDKTGSIYTNNSGTVYVDPSGNVITYTDKNNNTIIYEKDLSGQWTKKQPTTTKIIYNATTNIITLNNETYTCQDASCSTNGMHKFVLKNKYGEIIKTIRAVIENNKLNLFPKTPTN